MVDNTLSNRQVSDCRYVSNAEEQRRIDNERLTKPIADRIRQEGDVVKKLRDMIEMVEKGEICGLLLSFCTVEGSGLDSPFVKWSWAGPSHWRSVVLGELALGMAKMVIYEEGLLEDEGR